jgi:hypothetical protein
MEDLFLSNDLEFEKVAAEVELPEDPNTWQQEILQQLFKQIPFISDFEPHVVMDRVDAEKKYGFGHVEVTTKSEIPMGDQRGAQAAGVKTVRIPVIVNQGKLQPFDVLVTEDSKMLPLTENRLRQAVFRPQMFDVTSKTPGDQSMVSQLYPPQRQNNGMGSSGMTYGAGEKMGSDMSKVALGKLLGELAKKTTDPARAANIARLTTSRAGQLMAEGGASAAKGKAYATVGNYMAKKVASVLEHVIHTARRSDVAKVASAMEDPAVQQQFLKNKFANAKALRTIFEAPAETKTASVDSVVRPTVIQLTHSDEGGYTLKTANASYWDPQTVNIDRGEAIRRFGEKTVLAADMSEGIVASEGPQVENDGAEKDEYEIIKDYGLYKVKTEEGQELVGYVFPNLLDLDGKALPLALFTNGSQSAVQGEIVGVRAGEGQSLPQGGRPRGHGCFYRTLPNGKAEATLPMTVQASMSGNGASFQAELFDGQTVEVVGFQPNLQNIQLEGNQLLVPESFNWLPLDTSNEVSLMNSPEAPGLQGEMKEAFAKVTIRYNDGLFSLSGMPVDKIASDERSFLPLADTLFLLAGMGVSQAYAEEKLGAATVWSQPVQIKVARVLKLAQEEQYKAVKLAQESLEKIPSLKVSLVKEAAAIPDPLAVDTVLSIGFLNPENVMVFLEALPAMEKAQERMCELLVASRLGMREIPIAALENAVRNVEEVIEGLRVMAFQQN